MVVPYRTEGDSFIADRPQVWTDRHLVSRRNRSFDLHPDGERIALAAASDEASVKQDKVVVVVNFFDELRRIALPGK
jgi:hypothetical protein